MSMYFTLVDCEWDNWETGTCSKTCGGGVRITTRQIKIKAAHGGKECSGASNFTEECNVVECPGMIMFCQIALKGSS